MALAHQDVERLREASAREDLLRPIPADRLYKPPPAREWMVERCFTKGTVAMVSGDGGIGKSLLMQQLLTACCIGTPWLGLTTRPGRAAFLACEDDEDELHRRQWDINRHFGIEMPDVIDAGLTLFGRVGRDNALARFGKYPVEKKAEPTDDMARRHSPQVQYEWRMKPTELADRVFKWCLAEGITYLVIDTATQTFAGNQNDEQQVVQFINILRRIALAIQGVVIFTKHPSMSGRALGTGESGNTAWTNSVRSRFYLHKGKTNGLVFDSRKSNYGPTDLSLPLRWERGCYHLDRPEPVRSPYAD